MLFTTLPKCAMLVYASASEGRNQLAIEIPAVRFNQGGRTVYAASPTIAQLLDIVPIRQNTGVIEDANRRLFESHAKAFGDYILVTEDWVSGALMLGCPPSELEWSPGGRAGTYGKVRLANGIREQVKLFDGQHRRYGLAVAVQREMMDLEAMEATMSEAPDPEQVEADISERKERLDTLLGETIPIIIYEENDLVELQQMFADISHVRVPDPITVARFDRRNPFNLAAYQLANDHPALKDRVEMERNTLTPQSNKLITLNQLGSVLAVLFRGIGARNRAVEIDSDNERASKVIYDRGKQFFDDISESSEALRAVAHGSIEPLDARQKGSLTTNVTMLKVFAGIWHDLVITQNEDRGKVVRYMATLPEYAKDVDKNAVWARAGVINPDKPGTPNARAGELREAVKLAKEEFDSVAA